MAFAGDILNVGTATNPDSMPSRCRGSTRDGSWRAQQLSGHISLCSRRNTAAKLFPSGRRCSQFMHPQQINAHSRTGARTTAYSRRSL